MVVMRKTTTIRADKTQPHVSLKALRKVSKMTMEQVAEKAASVLGRDGEPISRGTISAIENGKRGASQQMLDAIAIAYGLKPGDIVTDFQPRAWKAAS